MHSCALISYPNMRATRETRHTTRHVQHMTKKACTAVLRESSQGAHQRARQGNPDTDTSLVVVSDE